MWRLHELDPLRTIAALRLYVEANRLHLHQWLDTEQNNLVAELVFQELNDIGYYTQTTASVECKIKVLIPTVGRDWLRYRDADRFWRPRSSPKLLRLTDFPAETPSRGMPV